MKKYGEELFQIREVVKIMDITLLVYEDMGF